MGYHAIVMETNTETNIETGAETNAGGALVCAAIQMTSSADLRDNLKRAAGLVGEAAARGASLIVLPEMFAFIGKRQRDQLGVREAAGGGPVRDFLSEQAARHGVWLVGGTLPVESPDRDRAWALSPLMDASGAAVAAYRKIHLFDVDLPEDGQSYRESGTFKPGADAVVADTPFGRVGLAVCYDLRFPEMFRLLSEMGADLVAVPSAFTAATGAAHWEPLVRARAIENQVCVIAANQTGRHANGKSTYGHSCIVDCWGVVRAGVSGGEGVAVAEVDFNRQRQLRRSFPCLEHRVFSVGSAP